MGQNMDKRPSSKIIVIDYGEKDYLCENCKTYGVGKMANYCFNCGCKFE